MTSTIKSLLVLISFPMLFGGMALLWYAGTKQDVSHHMNTEGWIGIAMMFVAFIGSMFVNTDGLEGEC